MEQPFAGQRSASRRCGFVRRVAWAVTAAGLRVVESSLLHELDLASFDDRHEGASQTEQRVLEVIAREPTHRLRGSTTCLANHVAVPRLIPTENELETYASPGSSTEAVQRPARVNVRCVTPLGEEVASIS